MTVQVWLEYARPWVCRNKSRHVGRFMRHALSSASLLHVETRTQDAAGLHRFHTYTHHHAVNVPHNAGGVAALVCHQTGGVKARHHLRQGICCCRKQVTVALQLQIRHDVIKLVQAVGKN